MKGSRHIDNLSVGIYGGIQMAALRKQGDLDHDGLLQRFIPVLLRPAVPYEDVAGHEEARDRDFEGLLHQARRHLPARLALLPRGAGDLPRGRHRQPRAHASRRRRLRGFPRLDRQDAETLRRPRPHPALRRRSHHRQSTATRPISEDTARKARTIVNDFILPHGFRFYADYAGGSGKTLVVAVADCILRWNDRQPCRSPCGRSRETHPR